MVDRQDVERVLPLPVDLSRELQDLRHGTDAEPVFPSATTGGRMRRQEVNEPVRRATADAGVGPSWLRHAYAWNALAEGRTLAELQTSLGHLRRQATRRYRRAVVEQDRASDDKPPRWRHVLQRKGV